MDEAEFDATDGGAARRARRHHAVMIAAAAAVLAAVVPAIVLASQNEDPSPASSAPRASTSDAPTESPTAADSPTPAEPTPTAPVEPAVSLEPAPDTDGLIALLLPTFNPSDRLGWTVDRTGEAEDEPFGTCARGSLTSLGANAVVERTYTWDGNGFEATAGQQLARFPDADTAARAWRTLEEWRDSCGTRQVDGVAVGDAREFARDELPAGIYVRGYWLGWMPNDAGGKTAWEHIGLAREGNLITVLYVKARTRAMDFITSPVIEPLSRAVARLG
jgi:hypothetical protein